MTTEAQPGAWHADPLGRYEQRHFDGTQWTERVISGGVQRVDPQPVVASPTARAMPAGPVTQASPAADRGDPQWDKARGTYIIWDPDDQRWPEYDRSRSAWRTIR